MGRFQEQVVSAREWKSVAETRYKYLLYINTALTEQIDSLGKIGTIFGQEHVSMEGEDIDPRVHSGETVTQMVIGKLTATSNFVGNLTKEATQVQGTLNHVLSLAAEAISVERPTQDVSPAKWTEETSNASSPLAATYAEIEDTNVPSPTVETQVSVFKGPVRGERDIDPVSQAMNLFRS